MHAETAQEVQLLIMPVKEQVNIPPSRCHKLGHNQYGDILPAITKNRIHFVLADAVLIIK